MKKVLLFIIIIFSFNFFTPSTLAATKNFSDLPKNSTHYEGIMKVVEQGLLSGYPDGTFRPGNTISRKQVATIIDKAFPNLIYKKKNESWDVDRLNDITKKDSAYQSIKKVYDASIMYSYRDKVEKKSYFKPNDPISRADLAIIINKLYGYYDSGWALKHKFADEKEILALNEKILGVNLLHYIRPVHFNKIMSSYPDNTFRPNEPVTRAQFASIIVKAQENMSEAHRQMYNLTLYKYKEPKDVPLPKGITNVQALNKQQQAEFKKYIKTNKINVIEGWNYMFSGDYEFSEYIELYSERFNFTEKEFVELINRLVKTGEVYTGITKDSNEFKMYYDFENGRLYKKW